MFRQKLAEPKKAKKRHGFAYWVIAAFTMALESMLGINAAFLVDQSVGLVAHRMLDGTWLEPLGAAIALIISLVVGVCFMLAGYWTFSGFMDSLDDAWAFWQKYTSWCWPVVIVWGIAIAIAGLDSATLMFRASYFSEKGAIWLIVFFFILIPLVWVIGIFMHVLENTPVDRRMSKSRRFAEQIVTQDVEQAIQEMDPDLRLRVLNGDDTAYEEHYQRIAAMREENRLYEEAQVAAREAEKLRRKKDKNPPFLRAVP